jgi:hypothetical protein
MISVVMGMREEMSTVSNDHTILLLKIELCETNQQHNELQVHSCLNFVPNFQTVNLIFFCIQFLKVKEKKAELYMIYKRLQI